MSSTAIPTSYIVSVLWMNGRSIHEIAKVSTWTPGKVRGFTTRTYNKPSRAHMTNGERQLALDALRAQMPEGLKLPDKLFRVLPVIGVAPEPKPRTRLKALWSQAIVDAEAVEDEDRRQDSLARCALVHRERFSKILTSEGQPDLSTKAGRRDLRTFEAEVVRLARAKQKEAAARQEGHAVSRGKLASALDYLFDRRLLKDAAASGKEGRTSEEQRRHEAGTRLRAYIDGTRLGSLGAMDYERATMGSGGGPKISLSAYKLHCVHSLGTLRKLMGHDEYVLIETVIDKDDFAWDRVPTSSAARARVFEAIRRALDVVAVLESLLTREAFKARWGTDLPLEPLRDRQTKGEAAAQSARVADILEAAR